MSIRAQKIIEMISPRNLDFAATSVMPVWSSRRSRRSQKTANAGVSLAGITMTMVNDVMQRRGIPPSTETLLLGSGRVDSKP